MHGRALYLCFRKTEICPDHKKRASTGPNKGGLSLEIELGGVDEIGLGSADDNRGQIVADTSKRYSLASETDRRHLRDDGIADGTCSGKANQNRAHDDAGLNVCACGAGTDRCRSSYRNQPDE